MKIAAAILAGGKASRFNGLAKGNLALKHRETIIASLIQALVQVGIKDIIISANDTHVYQRYHLPIVKDVRENFGPLAGIESILSYYREKADAVIILPCDLPNVTYSHIENMVEFYRLNDAMFIYAFHSQQLQQPLFCIIPMTCELYFKNLLDVGVKKVQTAWDKMGAKHFVFEEAEMFCNINTHEDFYKGNLMRTIFVDAALIPTVKKWDAYDEMVSVSSESEALLSIKGSIEKESTSRILYEKSFIPCSVALSLAKNLNMNPLQIGALLNLLNIKVRHCQLGCFK